MQNCLDGLITLLYKIWLRVVYKIHVGSDWILMGLPIIRVGGVGSRIRIGNYFRAISRIRSNSIGVLGPVVIRTTQPNAEIVIGDNVGVSGCVISAARYIAIGDNTLIGSGALIMDNDAHLLIASERDSSVLKKRFPKGRIGPVIIGKNVFVGARAMILKGVHIGDNAIIGAGSVVRDDVPSGATVIGNPAAIIKCEA